MANIVKTIVSKIMNRLKPLPAPPEHSVKQAAIRELAARFGTRTMVETGTYRGDMVAEMLPYFDRIISIELSEELHRNARERFRDEPKVTLLQGDSGERITDAIAQIDGPALFWLDGHYSGGVTAMGESATPVVGELKHILDLGNRGHVILIDDARLFGRDPDYPSVAQIARIVEARGVPADLSVENDAIRIVPKLSA